MIRNVILQIVAGGFALFTMAMWLLYIQTEHTTLIHFLLPFLFVLILMVYAKEMNHRKALMDPMYAGSESGKSWEFITYGITMNIFAVGFIIMGHFRDSKTNVALATIAVSGYIVLTMLFEMLGVQGGFFVKSLWKGFFIFIVVGPIFWLTSDKEERRNEERNNEEPEEREERHDPRQGRW